MLLNMLNDLMCDMNCVIVPQEDIDKLEKARKDLFKFLEQGSNKSAGRFYPESLNHVTEPMLKITHRKYKRIAPIEVQTDAADLQNFIDELKRMSSVIFLVVQADVARDISDKMIRAATELKRLSEINQLTR